MAKSCMMMNIGYIVGGDSRDSGYRWMCEYKDMMNLMNDETFHCLEMLLPNSELS